MKTEVVNIRGGRHKDAAYIGRAGHGQNGYFGNPIRLGAHCPICGEYHQRPGDTLVCYEIYFQRRLETDPDFKRRVLELRGKKLGCFCKPNPCHGDVIAKYLNENRDDSEPAPPANNGDWLMF